MASNVWELSQAERDGVVEKAAAGICSLCYFGEHGHISEDVALAAARKAEKTAYNRAQVESHTTTGARPRIETERAYFRILSQAVLECVKTGCADVANQPAAHVTGDFLDLSGSGREFMTPELVTELLAPMLAPGSTVAGVKLSTKSFDLPAAAVAADAIANVKGTLKVADISDIIAGRKEADVLEALKTVSGALAACALDELNVSDNALGEKGIRACAEALKIDTLKVLYLQNIGCSVNACRAVQELVKSSALEKLHLHNNMSDNEGAIAIASLLARNSGMLDFKMVSSRVGPEGALALVDALARGSSLCQLDLSDNPITAAFTSGLPALFAAQASLMRLALNDVCLQDAGMTALSAALRAAPAAATLDTLELALNEISPASSASLAAALAALPKLRTVLLAENELGCRGACHVAMGLARASALETLDMRTNQIGRVGATVLARCCATNKPAMKRLELNDNVISEAGVAKVHEILEGALGKEAVLSVLGALDENDEENDPEEDEAEGEAREELEDFSLDFGKLSM